jgi:RHS repeat-associated protein
LGIHLYRGESADRETGLQYLRARYNDSETGRFISSDPFEGMTNVPMSKHRYLYGYDNPLKFEDPSGMDAALIGSYAVAFTLVDMLAALSIGISAQALFALAGNRDTEWDGALTLRALPESIPLIPFGLSDGGLGNLTVGFVTATARTFEGYSNTWLIVGASAGIWG